MMGPALFDLYSPTYNTGRRRSSSKEDSTPLLKVKSTSSPSSAAAKSSSATSTSIISSGLQKKKVTSADSLVKDDHSPVGRKSAPRLKSTSLQRYRTFKVSYLGSSVLDRRHTYSMLPWVIADIKRRATVATRHGSTEFKPVDILLEVTDIALRALTADDRRHNLFVHPLQNIQKFAQKAQDGSYFTYLIRDQVESPFTCHVFHALDESVVLDIINSVRDATKEVVPKVGSQLLRVGSCSGLDNILANSQQYEVMYVGRIRMSQKRAPPSFIDEAVEKFKDLEANRNKINEVDNEDKPGECSPWTSSSPDSSMFSLSMQRPRSISSLTTCTEYREDESYSEETNSPAVGKPTTINDEDRPPSAKSMDLTMRDSIVKDLEEYSRERDQQDCSLSPNKPPSSSSNSLHLPSASLIPSTQSLDEEGRASIMKDLQECNVREQLAEEAANLSSQSRIRSASGDVPRAQKQVSLPYYRTRTNSGGKDIRKERQSARLQNKTMLFLIGRLELCLISPDRHQVLLNKTFNYVSHCSQGVKHTDHFGFICRETSFNAAETYVGYVFRCQTEKLVEEIMHALKQAFHNAHHAYQSNKNKAAYICSTCPMDWFHHVCCDIESLAPERAQSVIFRRIESLPDQEQKELMNTYQENHGSFVESIQDQNEVLMNLLRKMCERKQMRHQHTGQEAILEKRGSSSTLGSLKQKAKKSLSNSFETILKRTNQMHETRRGRAATIDFARNYADRLAHGDSSDHTTPESLSPVSRTEFSFSEDLNARPRSATISGTKDVCRESTPRMSSRSESIQLNQQSPKSPLFNIFMKIGNQKTSSIGSDSTSGISSDSSSSSAPSWRRTIFSNVQTQGKKNVKFVESVENRPRKTREELRTLWKEAIKQQILLIQMEKENKRLQANQSQVCYKRMKLDYEEVSPPGEQAARHWERILHHRPGIVERSEIVSAVSNGLPKYKRGEIWIFLAEQQKLGNFLRRKDCSEDGINLETPFRELLQQLTVQQHAILVDLGRTFPKHPFYAQPLGPGQLSLFNLLKAYSLFDKEVGYCQGLSFVAGILLLHMNEDEAFEMMKHLLFYHGLRKQYKPDMSALQMQLYQLTRLLYDHHHDLYQHFERHDISPTLYAAPWFLTLFASQFSIGFVARLFDLIFLNGLEAVFRISLTLLASFKEALIGCHSFESIMDFIKVQLPSMDYDQTEAVFKAVHELDIGKKLELYEIEYSVLQEEMLFTTPSTGHTPTAVSTGSGGGGGGGVVVVGGGGITLPSSLPVGGAGTGIAPVEPEEAEVEVERNPLLDSPLRKEVSTETYSEINERLKELEDENRSLRRSNMESVDQLHVSQSTVHSLESQLDNYKSTIKRLETRVRSMEDERDALLQSLNILRRRLERLEASGSETQSLTCDGEKRAPTLNIIGVGGESKSNANYEDDEDEDEDYDEEDVSNSSDERQKTCREDNQARVQ